MKLDDYLAVSGMPGVYRLAGSRNNGIIVEDLDSGKKKFVSARKHMFTPLSSISIYTTDIETEELKNIFQTMLTHLDEWSPHEALASNTELFSYFEKVLPNYDRDRVYVGDIKKVVKWFVFLSDRNLLSAAAEEEE